MSKSYKLSRRALAFGSLASATFAALGSPSRGSADERVHIFIDESGKPPTGPENSGTFVICSIALKNPDAHRNEIAALRAKASYIPALRYSSTDRNRLPFAKEIVKYLSSIDGMKISVTITSSEDGKFLPRNPKKKAALYATMYLDNLSFLNSTNAVVYTQRRMHCGGTDKLSTYIQQRLPTSQSVQIATEADELIQLTGLLAGCVFGDINGSSGLHKVTIMNAMATSLGLTSLSTPVRRSGLQIKRFFL
jgi:hypothetical protein